MALRIILIVIGLMATLVIGCKKEETVSRADLIKKVWTVQSVTENGTRVYSKGAASPIRNYAAFQLDLSNPPTVIFVEVDGSRLVGQYVLENDNRLILSGLAPQPTGSGGRLEYVINALSNNSLELSQVTTNLKTGNTTNVYTLTNP